MILPLLERATVDGETFSLTKGLMGSRATPPVEVRQLIPGRTPDEGEQYRFHFDMTKCVGCKCCVVACNEQNGNPAHQHWRRVGEIEGGTYPATRRWHLSMGCNQCLEPSCLIGCPVEAYSKNSSTGVVEHSADICIGCQYCTWNCSYGVPQYNEARGVVGKCDMCHNRLAEGDAPACVESCPQSAIEIEIVNIADWRANHSLADAPGLPSSYDSLSTTRVTLPSVMPANLDRVDRQRQTLEAPHWPLVFMLTMTQMAVGAVAAIWALSLARPAVSLVSAAILTLAIALLSLMASTLHLGRPVHAYRAMKAWRRSWLSREVLALGLFAQLATLYAASIYFDFPFSSAIGVIAVLSGIAGIVCSARIYIVPARPAWNSNRTLVDFLLTGFLLGPLLLRAAGFHGNSAFTAVAVSAAAVQLVGQAAYLLSLARSNRFELYASAMLQLHKLRHALSARFCFLVAGGIVLPVCSDRSSCAVVALLLALAGELIARWLFFVSVTPKSVASSFIQPERAA
jgi:formate dehydrogenase iron-sulfur subunit